jgi:probable phosphoglycerate mutase
MTPLAVIRHGPTDWNEAKRLQGRADRSLSERGRRAVAAWRLPEEFRGYDWYCSPLGRARETAALLGLACTVDGALVEMDWGAWEGKTGPELIEEYGDEFRNRTQRGIDLRPHDGESPREVRERIAAWAGAVAERGRPSGAVCHQGVIRALLSLATGWQMIGEPPYELDWSSLHVFDVAPDGRVAVGRLNISLVPS